MWRQTAIRIASQGRGFQELTGQIETAVRAAGIRTGLCHLFLRHTSAIMHRELIVTLNGESGSAKSGDGGEHVDFQ